MKKIIAVVLFAISAGAMAQANQINGTGSYSVVNGTGGFSSSDNCYRSDAGAIQGSSKTAPGCQPLSDNGFSAMGVTVTAKDMASDKVSYDKNQLIDVAVEILCTQTEREQKVLRLRGLCRQY